MSKEYIYIRLHGRFKVSSECGVDLTPKGVKTQAMIALLATASDKTRTRSWLQEKLWSDRSFEQSTVSLRQAIYQAKRTLGKFADCILSDRKVIQLDPNIALVEEQDGTSAEFLEGLLIKDREFSAWLAEQRSPGQPLFSSRANAQPAEVRKVFFDLDATEPGELTAFASSVRSRIIKSLRETGLVDIGSGSEPNTASSFVVRMHAFSFNGAASLSINLEDMVQTNTIWSEMLDDVGLLSQAGNSARIFALCNRLQEALSDAVSVYSMPRAFDQNANLLANIGVRKLFSMKQANVEIADSLFQQAYDIEPRGIFLAWRAQAQTIAFMEGYKSDHAELRDIARYCAEKAQELDPVNSNVLAAVANFHCFLDGNLATARELANVAINVNPANPLAWWSMSAVSQYCERYKEALVAARHAQRLAEKTRFRFWTDTRRAIAATATQDMEEVSRYGELSSGLSPSFRPPLRYVAAAYAKAGKVADAQHALERLCRIEPDFTLERMIDDRTYPVGLMRKTGLIKQLKDLK